MANFDPVTGWVIDQLLADTNVNASVAGRIYRGNIHTLTPNPTYPLITLERPEPGFYDLHVPVEFYTLTITVYSSSSADEAYRLMSYITPKLRLMTEADDPVRWVIRPITSAFDDFDEKGERILLVSQDFLVQQIG